MSEHQGSNMLETLLLGGLIGAALGVLFAPQAGERSRETLKGTLKELGMEGLVEKFSEAFEAGKEEVERVRKEGEM